MSASRVSLCAAALVALASCSPDAGWRASHADGVAALEEGRASDAVELLALALDRAGERADVDLLTDAALAALAAGDPGGAERSARRLLDSGRREPVERGHFLLGAASLVRADLAAAQAEAVEAEPFAWDAAIALARSGRESFVRALLSRGRWPEAARNAERAERRLRDWTRRRDEAAGRAPRVEPDGAPRVNLVPTDGGGEEGAERDDGGAAAPAPLAELGPGELERLLGVLEREERAKLEGRRRRALARSAEVERDW